MQAHKRPSSRDMDSSGEGSKETTPTDDGKDEGEDKEEVSGHGHHEEEERSHEATRRSYYFTKLFDMVDTVGSKATFDSGQPSSSGEKGEAERILSDDTRVGLKQVLEQQSLGGPDNVSSGDTETRPKHQPMRPPLKSLDEIWMEIEASESTTDHRYGFRYSEGPSRLQMQRREADPSYIANRIYHEPTIEVPPPSPRLAKKPTICSRPRKPPKSESKDTTGESSQSSTFATGEDIKSETEYATRESSQSSDQAEDKKIGQSRVQGEPRDDNTVEGVGDLPSRERSKKDEIIGKHPAECQEPSSSKQYDASKGKTAEVVNPKISSQDLSSRSKVDTDSKSKTVGVEVVDPKISSQYASSSSKDDNASKAKMVAVDVLDPKISLEDASSSSKDDNDSKAKTFAIEVVDPKISSQEASSSSQDDNDSKAKTVAVEVLNPKISLLDATTSHEESVSVSTGEASDSHQGNVQESSQLLVPPRVQGLSKVAEDLESPSSPENISDDEIPAWKRKLIKVVSICCFCNTTNQP